MFEPVLNHFELQRPDRADDLAAVHLAGEQLGHAFVHQLVDPFGQLLEFHRVAVFDVTEQLRQEARDADELQLFAFGKRVAYFEVAGVVQADDIAREGFVDHRFLFGHKCGRRGELDVFAGAYMQVRFIAFENSRTNLQEGDPVAVVRVHVRMDFKEESGQFGFVRVDVALRRMRFPRRRGDVDKTVEQLADAEIVQRAAEENRRDRSGPVTVQFERRIDPFDQFQVVAQMLRERFDVPVDSRIVQFDVERFPFGRLLVGAEE